MAFKVTEYVWLVFDDEEWTSMTSTACALKELAEHVTQNLWC